ncbi:uncharacterized protein [Coffea arabica]|uniref:Reverse transcriptase/retrotransposon-derived protein RNase H-like domain-containing protein n=1 Tax=Coffea arabica TaxID=13443 RepID=A0ABM4WPB1_COFAR
MPTLQSTDEERMPFEWDESCRNAFTSIKMYLMNPSVLAAPIPGKLLILYIFAQERSVGALLAQENDEGKENALYYLSRMMTSNELNYLPIEKLYLELTDELPNEEVFMVESSWSMYFDGVAHRDGASVGVVFYTPKADILQYSFILTRRCSNNVTEYQALILGLETAIDMKNFNQQADSLARVASMITLPSHQNQILICQNWVIPPMFDEEDDGGEEKTYHIFVHEIEKKDWRHLIIDYLNHGKLHEDLRKRVDVRRRTPHFIYYKGTLYRKSFDGVSLRCLGEDEAMQAMEEAHSGICGAH